MPAPERNQPSYQRPHGIMSFVPKAPPPKAGAHVPALSRSQMRRHRDNIIVGVPLRLSAVAEFARVFQRQYYSCLRDARAPCDRFAPQRRIGAQLSNTLANNVGFGTRRVPPRPALVLAALFCGTLSGPVAGAPQHA